MTAAVTGRGPQGVESGECLTFGATPQADIAPDAPAGEPAGRRVRGAQSMAPRTVAESRWVIGESELAQLVGSAEAPREGDEHFSSRGQSDVDAIHAGDLEHVAP
jgi:hypothetical protein